MSYQTSSTGRLDAENAAKGMQTAGTSNYSKNTHCDFCNKPMTRNLDLSQPESIITMVCRDHEKLRTMYNNFKQCAMSETQERENLAAGMIREISIHSFLEENLLYPQYKVLLGELDGKAAEKHSLDEHQKIKNLCYNLDQDFDVKNSNFNIKLDEIMKVFNHHSHEEESDFLVQLQSRAPQDKLIDLGKQFESKKKTAPTRPHPDTSSSTAAGMMAKPYDAIRDAATGRSDMAQRAANKE